MRTLYTHKTSDSIYKLWSNPPDFSKTKVVELGATPMGFPMVNGEPIREPRDWYEFMNSSKFILFQGTRQLLDASLKPLLSLAQVTDLYKTGEVWLNGDTRIRIASQRIKLEEKFDINEKPHKVNRLVNMSAFYPPPLPEKMLEQYPAAYYEEMKKYGIPVTDMLSPAATTRNAFIYYDEHAFWDLERWIEEDPKREDILDFFKDASPPPIQETSLVGHEGGLVKCVDYVTQHLNIAPIIPLMVPGYCTLDFTPGYNPNTDIHGAHEISVFIVPGRHRFGPIIQRFGEYGTPIPIVGQVDHAKVTQQTIEDLLWSGYELSDITFHKSIRVQLLPGRGLLPAFAETAKHLKEALSNLSEVFSPKAHYQTAGGNFLATYVTWIGGKPVRVALPTYNPLYWAFLRGKAWSLVWRLSELLENPINRNPDEVYTTDKNIPTQIDGFPLQEKEAVDNFVQFDPYLKSTTGLGAELIDFSKKHPDKKKIAISRDIMIGIAEVVETGNLFALGTIQPRSVSLSPSGGARELESEVPNLGYILEYNIKAKNIQSGKAKKVADKVGRYGRDMSKILDK